MSLRPVHNYQWLFNNLWAALKRAESDPQYNIAYEWYKQPSTTTVHWPGKFIEELTPQYCKVTGLTMTPQQLRTKIANTRVKAFVLSSQGSAWENEMTKVMSYDPRRLKKAMHMGMRPHAGSGHSLPRTPPRNAAPHLHNRKPYNPQVLHNEFSAVPKPATPPARPLLEQIHAPSKTLPEKLKLLETTLGDLDYKQLEKSLDEDVVMAVMLHRYMELPAV